MATAELTIQLPVEQVEFLKNYAQEHGTTIEEVVARCVQRLKSPSRQPLHPDIVSLTGLVPEHLEVETIYRQHLLDKHR